MNLLDYMFSGTRINKKATLTKRIKLSNGEIRKKGDEVTILLDFGDGTYHAEDNEWACKVSKNEFIYK
jgi:hypothetical protein